MVDGREAGTSSTPVLELESLTKRFGRLAVLRGVDLCVRTGEVVGLLGANGAGKTTLLSIVAGLLPASSGSRSYFGRRSDEVTTDLRARIALVSHTAQLYPRLSAIENLELFADLRSAAGARVQPGAPLLQRLGLGHASDRMAGTFSRGMLQRLALARALLGKPELLLLDEPFTALDRPGRALLARVLRDERDRGAAILLISHDVEALVSVADRVVLLEGGCVAGEVSRRGDDDEAASMFRDGLGELVGRMPAAPVQEAGHA